MSPAVAVYGAYGHTGRFALAELRRRGFTPVLSGRDAAQLGAIAQRNEPVRPAATDDPSALDRALAGCVAVFNCTGPAGETGQPLIDAALRARIPYLGVAGEPDHVLTVLETSDAAAREAGVAILPTVGFYGGLGALLAAAAADDWTAADDVLIAIALSNWNPTRASRATRDRMAGRRWVYRDGGVAVLTDAPAIGAYDYPAPFGHQAVMEGYPAPDALLVPRFLKTPNVQVVMALAGLAGLRQPEPPPPSIDFEDGRADQTFLVQARVTRGDETREVHLVGRDIYAFSALLQAEALRDVLATRPAGVLALPEAVSARDFVRRLAPALLEVRLP